MALYANPRLPGALNMNVPVALFALLRQKPQGVAASEVASVLYGATDRVHTADVVRPVLEEMVARGEIAAEGYDGIGHSRIYGRPCRARSDWSWARQCERVESHDGACAPSTSTPNEKE